MKLTKIENPEEPDFDLELHAVSVHDAFQTEKIEIEFVVPGLPLAEVGILGSSGGTGKSYYALEAMFQVSTGRCCSFDLGISVHSAPAAKVMYVSLEDKKAMLVHRLQSIKEYWANEDKDKSDWLDDVAEHISILALAGLGVTLINEKGKKTKVYDAILNKAKDLRPRLIVIDTLRRAHDCDENSNGAMSQVLRHFELMAEQSGAAILLLHHENKAGAGDAGAGAAASRGASAIIDNARYAMRLQTMTQTEAEKRDITELERKFWVYASLEKANYSTPFPGAWLRRCKGGVLIAAEPSAAIVVPLKQAKTKVGSNGWK